MELACERKKKNHCCIHKYEGKTGRIHSRSGFSVKFECRAFPTLSTIAEIVMDDSMHKMAVIASNRVTSFLNISLACAGTLTKSKYYGSEVIVYSFNFYEDKELEICHRMIITLLPT